MKRTPSNSFIRVIFLLVLCTIGISTYLSAQTWLSVESGGINISSAVTIYNPQLQSFNGNFYAVWIESGKVRVKRYDGGTTWVAVDGGGKYWNSAACANLATAVYNNALYISWQENDTETIGITRIHALKYDGTTFTFVQSYTAGSADDGRHYVSLQQTQYAYAPALGVHNGKLYISWIEGTIATFNYQIHVSEFDGTYWKSVDGGNTESGLNKNYNGLFGKYEPNLTIASYGNNLYVSWREYSTVNSQYQFRVKRFDGGSTWTFVDGNMEAGLNYNSAKDTMTPRIISCNGYLYAIWSEDTLFDVIYGVSVNQIRVKKYNGTSWTYADGGTDKGWNLNNSDPENYAAAYDPTAMVYNNQLYIAWEESDIIGWTDQIRAVKYDGTTKTFIAGGGVYGINQNTLFKAQIPVMAEYNGELYTGWQENTGSGTPYLFRIKKTNLSGITTSVTVPANGTYKISDILNFTVNFNKNVNVSGGVPYIPITLTTGGTVNATYQSGTGTKALVFRYTVANGNADPDGISIGTNIVLPVGCTLRDATSYDASLTLNSVGNTTAVLIDGIAPTVSSINRQIPATTPTNATSLIYRVTFSRTVTGVGTNDFTLTTSDGATGGSIATVATISGSIYDVTVNSLLGFGTFRLDLNNTGTGITDTPGNPISGGYNSGQTYTTLSPGTWTGASGTAWTLAENWAGLAVPTSTTDVIIPDVANDPIISDATTANCNNLTVTGSLTIKSSASGTGSLIVSGISTGTVTTERYMTGNKWHIVSPTSAGGSISTFIQASENSIPVKNVTNYGMMDYYETGNSWNSYFTTGTGGTLTAGKGYNLRRSSDGTVTFTGTLTSGTKSVILTKIGSEGWNCVGNPYSSSINMNISAHATNNFISLNSNLLDASYACVYVWDEDASFSGQNCYKVISNSGFVLPGKTYLSQNYVAPGQGFFVKTAANNNNLQFTIVLQTHQPTIALKSAKVSWPGFQLNAVTAQASASIVIAFNSAMTTGLDITYDAGLLHGTSGLELYSRLVNDNGVDFAIQCLPETYNSLVIPISLESKTGGEITFSAETVELPSTCRVILEDKLAKIFTSLDGGAKYNTTVSAGTTAVGRFYIHTSNLTTGTSEVSNGAFILKAYYSSGVIIIEGEVGNQAQAFLFDVKGRKIATFNLQEGNRNTIYAEGLIPGVYLLSVTQAARRFNNKIIIY